MPCCSFLSLLLCYKTNSMSCPIFFFKSDITFIELVKVKGKVTGTTAWR